MVYRVSKLSTHFYHHRSYHRDYFIVVALNVLLVTFMVLFAGGCGSTILQTVAPTPAVALPPPTPTSVIDNYALLSKGVIDIQVVTIQEALQALDFVPVWPTVLMPETVTKPKIFVVADPNTQPRLTLTYVSIHNQNEVRFTIEEGRASDRLRSGFATTATGGDRRLVSISGTPVSHGFYQVYGPRGEVSTEFDAAWEYRDVAYHLRVSTSKNYAPGPDRDKKVEETLAIVKGLLAAADAS